MQLPENSSILDERWSALFAPRTELGIIEWGMVNMRPPNAARTGGDRFDIDPTPWLRAPAEAAADPETRRLVMLAPTGGSKTTLGDLVLSHHMTEGAGSALIAMQSDPDADAYWDERLEPILLAIPKMKQRISALAKGKARKGEIIFPDRTLYVKGPSRTTFQRKSVVDAWVDEAWRLKHGYLKEAESRLHNRWNRLLLITSQGGDANLIRDTGDKILTELEDAWQQTDQNEYCMVCPECGHVERWRLRNLKWTSSKRQDGSLDEAALIQSVRYKCPGPCGNAYEDKPALRRELAGSSIYRSFNPQYVPHPHGHFRGYRASCFAMPHESWADLALQWTRAIHALKQGDEQPKKIFVQQRLARNYKEAEQEQSTTLTLGDYTFADYLSGEEWQGEAARLMTVDVQRDHFWVVVRAWKADGSSRRLWAGRINTAGALREKQRTMKVLDQNTFIDAQFDTDVVYNLCGEHHWLGTHGDQADSYLFPVQNKRKFYSPIRRVQGTSGRPAVSIHWSNRQIKRILERFRGGYRIGQTWEVEKDITPELHGHLFSEVEKDVINKSTKAVERRFVRIGSRQNHTWDCEAMQVVGALIRGMLVDHPESAKPTAEQKPAPVSTN